MRRSFESVKISQILPHTGGITPMVTNFCSAEGSHDTLYTITLLNFKISCFYFIYVMVIRLSAIRLSAIRLSAIRLSAIRLSGYPLSGYPLSVIRYPVIRYPVICYPVIRYPVSVYPVSVYPVSVYPVSGFSTMPANLVQYKELGVAVE